MTNIIEQQSIIIQEQAAIIQQQSIIIQQQAVIIEQLQKRLDELLQQKTSNHLNCSKLHKKKWWLSTYVLFFSRGKATKCPLAFDFGLCA